ncbi:Mobile element protein [Salinisphaera sp. LB1]|nr:Mobile element protein [Salinisphaera sp. LB1]
MRQTHRAGEKLFVDYAGQTASVVDHRTGELRSAQIFVAVLGASNYTYAEATWSQSLPDWLPDCSSLTTRQRIAAARSRSYCGASIASDGRREVEVGRVIVTAQPLGAFEEALASAAHPDIILNGRVAVLDAGFYSLDWILIDAGAVKRQTAGTSLNAMSRLIEAMDTLVKEEHGDSPRTKAIEGALRNNRTSLLLYGQRIDLNPYAEPARRRVSGTGTAIAEMRRGYRDRCLQALSAPGVVRPRRPQVAA